MNWFQMVPGVANCSIHVDINTPAASMARELVGLSEVIHTLAIPGNSALIGLEVGCQWLLPTGSTDLPLDLSDASAIRIGAGY